MIIIIGKLAGQDKKNFGVIETDVVEELSSSPNLYSTSPVGPLTEHSSRKTLIYLILTLNQAYPDHDFSNLRPNNFSKEVGMSECKEAIEAKLFDVGKVFEQTDNGGTPFFDELWRCIDTAIELLDVEVYSYAAVNDGDPFDGDGSLWNFNYFFYNKKLKRMLFFSSVAKIKRGDDHSFFSDGDQTPPLRMSSMTPILQSQSYDDFDIDMDWFSLRSHFACARSTVRERV